MVSPIMSRKQNRYYRLSFLLAVALVYLVVFFLFKQLKFSPYVDADEKHFWPTSLLFSRSPIPSLELLRNYAEVNTPLPFIIFGYLEYLFHGGVFVGRLLNFVLSFLMICMVGMPTRKRDKTPVLAACGLLLFPYYLRTSIYLYTDIIAAFFVFIGFWLYTRSYHVLSSISFTLAIASRQFMLAFPVALAIYELASCWRVGYRISGRWLAPLVAASTILGWIWLFSSPVPQTGMVERHVSTHQVSSIFPEYSLYFLSCIGLYFVIPEFILFRRSTNLWNLFTRKNVFIAVGMLWLFIIFSPLHTTGLLAPGLLNRTAKFFLNDFLQVALFYVLALLACVRFSRINLAFWLLLSNCGIMIKAPMIWDKYALPLLIVFWYLKSIKALDNKAFDADLRCASSHIHAARS